ncbi:MAG: ATPase, T2SS/T4P/T4SS family, partial [Planctomycetota bacterium]
ENRSLPQRQSIPRATPLPWATLSVSDNEFSTRFVDALLNDAVSRDVTDIHLHPRCDAWEVLYRIDGVLRLVDRIPRSGPTDPTQRLMVMAGLPTYRSQEPQEGRLRDTPDNVEMRLGVFPTVHGTRAVVRLFRQSNRLRHFGDLNLPTHARDQLQRCCNATDGAVLLCGPAGSGKTTTLYAALSHIASDSNTQESNPNAGPAQAVGSARRSVLTIEDPVESLIDGVSQSQIVANDRSTGMNLAAALRSAVRQDPEVLLVSEIRDPETAAAVMQSALTGHLIFSTMHAGNVVMALRRLVQLGLPHYLISSALRLIVVQRLLRIVCPSCDGTAADGKEACGPCGDSGMHGRIPIAETIAFDGSDPVGDTLLDALADGIDARSMWGRVQHHSVSRLMDQADQLVAEGKILPSEIMRVL